MGLIGCTAAKELAAIRQVQFHLNGVSGARLAGIPLDDVRSPADLKPADLARLSLAIASHSVPLDLTVHIEGRNPETNTVTAKLVAMDWTCLLDDRDLVSGRLDEPYSFAPGRARDVPIVVRCDLLQVLGNHRADLIDAALSLSGRNTRNHHVSVELTPTVDTALGRIRYPEPIVLDLATPEAR
jgi:hypothetical protein